jgi:integrase
MLDYSLVVFQQRGKTLENAAISQMAPTTVSSSVRTREYLTTREIERLMSAARASSRWGHRDATMILIGYRHGLRASELCDLLWSQVELATGRLHVRRAKNGSPSVHPLQGDEIRALRRLQREQGPSSHVFMTERGRPDDAQGFPRAIRSDRRSGQDALRGSPAYASARLRLCAGQCRSRHPRPAGLAGAQEYPAYRDRGPHSVRLRATVTPLANIAQSPF